jgi:hypothetical protein
MKDKSVGKVHGLFQDSGSEFTWEDEETTQVGSQTFKPIFSAPLRLHQFAQ